MLGTHFYFNTIRNTLVSFGDVFNDVHVHKLDTDGNVDKDIKVPISIARHQRFLARLNKDWANAGGESATFQITLPRLSYDMSSLVYDPARKTNSLDYKLHLKDDMGVKSYLQQRSGIPYKLGIDLSVWTYNMDEMLQIAEQIVVFFDPGFSIEVADVPEMDIFRDIEFTLTDISMNDEPLGGFETFSIFQWAFSFTADIYIYPPIKQSDIIKKAITNFRKSNNYIYERITIEVDPFTAEKDEMWSVKKTIEDDIEG